MFWKPIDIFSNVAQVIESSGFGADKFTMVRNNDGTGSLKVVQPLDYEDKLQRNGFRFMIQVNDKVCLVVFCFIRSPCSLLVSIFCVGRGQ